MMEQIRKDASLTGHDCIVQLNLDRTIPMSAIEQWLIE